MTDITKCSNLQCPSASECYRVQAPDGAWQSYSFFAPELGKDQCGMFWDRGGWVERFAKGERDG